MILPALLATTLTAAQPAELAPAFFRARERGDASAVPATAALRKQLANSIRAHCFALIGTTAPRVTINGEQAEIDVDAVADVSSTMAGAAPMLIEEHDVLDAQRVDGKWQLTRWRRAEDLLTDRLAAAHGTAERWSLIDAHPELQTVSLERALSERAVRLINQQHYDDAESLAHIAGALAGELRDLGGRALAVGVDSILLRRRGNPDVAGSLALAREAAAWAEESHDPDVIANAVLRLGRALQFDEPVEARHQFERVVALRPYVEDLSRPGLAAGIIADSYRERGDYRAAVRYAQIAASVAAETGDPLAGYTASASLANTYESEGDYELAIREFERAVDFARKSGYREGVMVSLLHLAASQAALGRSPDALLDEALRLGTSVDEAPSFFADLYLTRGQYELDAGRLARAAADLQKALEYARAGKQSNQPGPVLAVLAEVRRRQHRYREAIDVAEQAMRAMAAAADLERFAPLVTAARADRALGRRDAAYAKLREALQVTEEERSVVGGNERQQRLFFASRVPAYHAMLDALIEDGRVDEALRIAEEAKGRTLLDALAGGRSLSEDLFSAEEQKREQQLRAQVAAAKDDASRRRARDELDSFEAVLYAKYPGLEAQRRAPAPATNAQMAALLGDERAAFVEFVVEEQRARVFVVRRRGGRARVDVRTIAIGSAPLGKRVSAYVGELAQRYHGYRADARALHDLLLAPVAPLLASASVIGIIPDGPLWHLPFESLLAPDGKLLVERAATFYAPSITVYRQMTRRHDAAPGAFLGFADPALPDAEREVRDVARLFPPHEARVYTGAAALESRAKAAAPQFSIIHFATHAVLDDTNPMYSYLRLGRSDADDGLLETWEMMRLDLHARLAVLSACDTGRGVVHPGEGLLGMSWALFVAGCPSTIVSKWRVESRTTAALMIDFYRVWLRSHARFARAEALRQARLQCLRDVEHRHPYYWSAFVLVGSGE
jgi:CHAT domain-containing protein